MDASSPNLIRDSKISFCGFFSETSRGELERSNASTFSRVAGEGSVSFIDNSSDFGVE